MKKSKENKMDITKIIKTSRKKKSSGGHNSKWLVRCNNCGKVFVVWDTDMYNTPCQECNNILRIDTRDKQDKKEDLFRVSRRLYNEYKSSNILSPKENSLLVELRETEFKFVLFNLISDYWFKPNSNYKYKLKEEKLIDTRGRQLLKNEYFIQLLEECYDLLYPRIN